jgi:FMN phosphatase YigB (HAD superfamily)
VSDAVVVGLIASVPATIAAIAALRVHHKADKIYIMTNGAYAAVQAELNEARKEIAALKALWEQS